MRNKLFENQNIRLGICIFDGLGVDTVDRGCVE